MELRAGELLVERTPSALDEAVLSFTEMLEDCDIEYVVVSGYIAILTGRSRSTEDVDIVIERLDADAVGGLAATLEEEGYWGMTTPLASLGDALERGDRVRIAEVDEMFPNFELWFVDSDIEREALARSITARVDDRSVQISPIELQIAYKLQLAEGIGTTDCRDFEDALHLYLTFEDDLKEPRLETYVDQLDAEDYYARLRTA